MCLTGGIDWRGLNGAAPPPEKEKGPEIPTWASAVVLVQKKDGSLRFCIDLRHLNSHTIKPAYSLPRIEESLDCLNGACIFMSLDLKSGYWQVEMDEKSIPYTTFTVGPLGFYKCICMSFGLTNAPTTFQEGLWNLVLGNYAFNTVLSIWMTSLFSPKLP